MATSSQNPEFRKLSSPGAIALAARMKAHGAQTVDASLSELLSETASLNRIQTLVRKALSSEPLGPEDEAFIPSLLKLYSRLGLAARWACKGASPEAAQARCQLVRQTCTNVEFLHKLPQRRMTPLAQEMTSFPVLASPHPGFYEEMQDQLSRLEVGKYVAPNFGRSSKFPWDDFTEVAMEFVDAMKFAPPKVDLSNAEEVERVCKGRSRARRPLGTARLINPPCRRREKPARLRPQCRANQSQIGPPLFNCKPTGPRNQSIRAQSARGGIVQPAFRNLPCSHRSAPGALPDPVQIGPDGPPEGVTNGGDERLEPPDSPP